MQILSSKGILPLYDPLLFLYKLIDECSVLSNNHIGIASGGGVDHRDHDHDDDDDDLNVDYDDMVIMVLCIDDGHDDDNDDD